MKGAAAVFLILFAALAVIVPTGAAPACAYEGGTFFVLLDNTAVYAEPNLSSAILITLEKDTQIAISGAQKINNVDWYVTYVNSRTGYVPACAVYQKYLSASYTTRYARISTNKKGDPIYVFSVPSADAQPLFELHDGTRVTLTGYESNGYLELVYRGTKGYILRESIVTGGFTYRQYLAFLVGVICVASVVVIGVLSRINKSKQE